MMHFGLGFNKLCLTLLYCQAQLISNVPLLSVYNLLAVGWNRGQGPFEVFLKVISTLISVHDLDFT